MTPQEIIAEAEEVKVMLQGLAAKKIGFGMDDKYRSFLQLAYRFVKSFQELARASEADRERIARLEDAVKLTRREG